MSSVFLGFPLKIRGTEGRYDTSPLSRGAQVYVIARSEATKQSLRQAAKCQGYSPPPDSCSNNEIGALFGGVSYSAVSKTYQRMLERLQIDLKLSKKIEQINASISNVKG